MAELVLQASDGHVARLAHEADPVRAIAELIWNAIDAEAWNVVVRVERDGAWEGINSIHVEDDGHGISRDEVETAFGHIGDSWKAFAEKSKNDVRGLHGSLGEGRLRAFALGARVSWESRSCDTAGQWFEIKINGRRSNRNVFSWDAVPLDDGPSRTRFAAYNDEQRQLRPLEADAALPTLRSQFAPILLTEPALAITYDGGSLDPAEEIAADTSLTLPIAVGGELGEFQLRIIEWRQGKHRVIYYGTDGQHFAFEEPGSEVEGHFPFSAYVSWSGLQDKVSLLPLGDMAPSPVGDLWQAARQAIRDHFAARLRERRRDRVREYKEAGVYPYTDEPTSEPEQAERAVFDVVSGALGSHIARKDKVAARLTLTLIRDAIRHDPVKLAVALGEVTALKPDDLDAFTALLGETTLPAIIKSANIISSRNKFPVALNHLIFDPVDSDVVGERDHLHRILEGELWIFGEGYNMMNSEKGLTEVLRTHLRLEGLPEKDAVPVKRWDGKSGRVDLHLAARAQQFDRVRHLIVELKAPDVPIGRRELDQVEDYANAIATNPQFAGSTAQWDIILVGARLDDVAKNRIHPDGQDVGRFWAPEPKPGAPRVTAYVRQWRDVIDENKRRLDYLIAALEHDPSTDQSLSSIRLRYADALPLLPSATSFGAPAS